MTSRQLWKPLSGAALLVFGLLFGAPTPAGASTSGCAGDVVVALDVAVWSRPGHDTYGFTLSEPLDPGEWSVQASSYDAYAGRSASYQEHEQWLLDITDHTVLGPTSDLADGVESAGAVDALGTFVSDGGVSHFTVRHAAESTRMGTNSVTAVCLAFSVVDPSPPTTTTTTTEPPTTTTSTTTTTTTTTTTAPPVTVPPTTTEPPDPLGAVIAASAVVDCLADEVVVLLGNQGDTGATVDVALPLAAVASGLPLDAGTLTTSTLAIGDLDGTTEIRVSDSTTGETYVRTPVTVDCADPARPTATTILDCAADVLVIRLGNDAGDPASLTVLHERVAVVAEVIVEAGHTVEVEIPINGAAGIPLRVVDAGGADVVRVEVENVCPPPDPPDDPAGPPAPPAEDDTDADEGPRVVHTDCDAVQLSSTDRFDLAVELDGTVVLQGSATGDVEIPVVPGAPSRIIVSEPNARSPDQVIQPDQSGCADVQVIVEPDCPSESAAVSIRREGLGRERFVVLVDGAVAGVIALEGTGSARIPVALGGSHAELTISRSMAAEPIIIGTVRCATDGGLAGPVASSLVVFAVIASAAGVLPWPWKLSPI